MAETVNPAARRSVQPECRPSGCRAPACSSAPGKADGFPASMARVSSAACRIVCMTSMLFFRSHVEPLRGRRPASVAFRMAARTMADVTYISCSSDRAPSQARRLSQQGVFPHGRCTRCIRCTQRDHVGLETSLARLPWHAAGFGKANHQRNLRFPELFRTRSRHVPRRPVGSSTTLHRGVCLHQPHARRRCAQSNRRRNYALRSTVKRFISI